MQKDDYDALICSHKGVDKLPQIVSSLLEQSLPPANIVICSTSSDDLIRIPHIYLKYINHIISPIPNQVVQRTIGITYCKSPYIFQLDDDLTLDRDCSKNLLDFLKINKHVLVSPLISISNQSFVPQGFNWLRACRTNLFTRFYLYIQGFTFSNPQSLKVLNFGTIVPLINKPKSPQKVDWLHSCRMYERESAYNISVMLSEGKSYFEDIFSSAEYSSKGYGLYLLPTALVFHPPVQPINTTEGLSMLRLQYNVLKKYGVNLIMLRLTIFLTFLYRLFFSAKG